MCRRMINFGFVVLFYLGSRATKDCLFLFILYILVVFLHTVLSLSHKDYIWCSFVALICILCNYSLTNRPVGGGKAKWFWVLLNTEADKTHMLHALMMLMMSVPLWSPSYNNFPLSSQSADLLGYCVCV